MFIAIDLGGSTVDILVFDEQKKNRQFISLESQDVDKQDLSDILTKAKLDITEIKKIILTGGHNRHFPARFRNISLQKVDEISAIGHGGSHLAQTNNALVISMGTGTCMVSVKDNNYQHVGGTGLGGGSLVGLGKLILQESNPLKISKMATDGDLSVVDLSVEDIVGGSIGIIPGFATAANFGKLKNPKPADLALGICNIIGQTIGAMANFAAQTHQHDQIVLTGKVTRIRAIVERIQKTMQLYGREVLVPPHGDFVGAVGAMIGADVN